VVYWGEAGTDPPPPLPIDSRWVPPVGGAPSRHTGTGGAADGVHGTRPVPEARDSV
jgi:hypothetical protein